MTVQEKADELLARCNGGFDNQFEWANWLTKHRRASMEPFPERKGNPLFKGRVIKG